MLFRFHIELSDIDRGIYQPLDFRVAQHPSESIPYLLTRVLAYALSFEEGLEFSPQGLGDTDGPALLTRGDNGQTRLWIEIGNPSARKLHRASKAAKKVIVYTYKSVEVLVADMRANDIHRAHEIEIYDFDAKLLLEIEPCLEKNNKWVLLVQDGHVGLEIGQKSFSLELKRVPLA